MIKTKARKQAAADKGEVTEKCLAENVQYAMQTYFEDLDGQAASELYSLFIEEVEKPFFKVVMQYTNGNITHAAQILGLNRITLRSRLKKYDIN